MFRRFGQNRAVRLYRTTGPAPQQLLAAPGVQRGQVISLMAQLSSPLPKAPVKDLKAAQAAYRKTGDAAAFIAALAQVAEKYGTAPTEESATVDATATGQLRREDLHLVCFDFLS